MVGKVDLSNDTFRYNDKGFTAIINQLIELCNFHYQKYNNFEINFSDYWVENFYDVPKKNITDNFYDVSLLWLDDFFKNGFPDYNAHNVVNYNDLKLRNYIFKNIFKIKDFNLLSQNKYDLGLHIRGTDKKNEIPIIECDRVISLLGNFLIKNKSIEDIYIATDEMKYIDCLKNSFKNKKFYYNVDNIISVDGNALHHGQYDKKTINFQVLKDCYTLKNCKNLFYCYSNVSLFSLMLGYNYHEQKILINDIK